MLKYVNMLKYFLQSKIFSIAQLLQHTVEI